VKPARAVVLASALAAALGASAPVARAADTLARTVEEIRRALASAKPGDRVRVAPGTYEGGLSVVDLRGADGRPIVLEAADPKQPPWFRGGGSGLHLSGCSHVEVHGLAFEGQTGNGVNVDDGGERAKGSEGVVLAGLTVRDVGPDGNCDGIKASGVRRFRVETCTVERWGRAGSAIDFVGCADGVVTDCTFRHVEGQAGRASGVQAKGGTRDVVVRRCRFEHAGGRAVNCGGSTGLAYFRPPLASWKGPRFEAKAVRVEGCTFVGSEAAVAFVGCDGATFRFNTVFWPGRWAMRILQETREEGFVPCRDGVVADNLFVFRSDRWSEGGVNRGAGTSPESFRFERNAWWCEDDGPRTRALVRLPSEERDGTYGVDPRFVDAETGDLKPRAGGPIAKVGAHAFPD
jgi:hypothetical protein